MIPCIEIYIRKSQNPEKTPSSGRAAASLQGIWDFCASQTRPNLRGQVCQQQKSHLKNVKGK